MERKFTIKKDIPVILILLLIAIGLFLFNGRREDTAGTRVLIEVNGEEYSSIALSEDREIEIKNPEGKVTNLLRIENGEAYMVSADCPDHLCMKQGRISHTGEALVCLPNRVVVTVEGDEESAFDSVAK